MFMLWREYIYAPPSDQSSCNNDRLVIERGCWDPKDGELCPSRTKPEETLVEVRRRSDVQIDAQTWV
jgi:hypothetical protein